MRSSTRNNNHPDNRNNNIGFRVLCSSTSKSAPLPEMPAGYGLLAEAGAGWMAQVSPVRT
ncbi:hypothetical protein [Nitrosomonas sp.]|uniref:hypothetical protein n=1 Tax=Nitrosomonas sp. TaxID=42353 RepID=UPI0025E8B307|nr:hypothetical protein [Nitrosomonas sp.]